MSEFTVEVPDDLDDDQVTRFLKKAVDKYESAFDISVAGTDRAVIDNVKVTDIELYDSGAVIYYDVEWSAYYGCSDMNFADIEERHIEVSRRGNTFVFQEYIAQEHSYSEDYL